MIIGTCGTCGGPVEGDMDGGGACKNCGATVKKNYGPKLPMNPPEKYRFPYYPHYRDWHKPLYPFPWFNGTYV